eukprot:CCRYP_007771-RA/>CCRYP_007771-RA protein AED:0.43 eAED:0.43 QI:0/0/0/1/0.5/0.33/3/0/140
MLNKTQKYKPLCQFVPSAQCYSKVMSLTIAYGISTFSTIGFAYFGGILGKLASKKISDKMRSKEVAGELSLITSETIIFVEHMQTAIQYRLQGRQLALESGDMHWAYHNRIMVPVTLFIHLHLFKKLNGQEKETVLLGLK